MLFSAKKGIFGAKYHRMNTLLIHTISRYLAENKRLVIPQLGSFIVKEPDRTILFSELMRRDDGVLRRLLTAEGLTEVEAAGEINRVVFEVRHATSRGIEYHLKEFGVFSAGANNTIAFRYDPQTTAAPADGGTSARRAEPAPAARETEGADERTRTAPEPKHEAEPRLSASAKMQPEPCVRGLRYGKPPKSTDAYTYLDAAPRRRVDRFMLLAVIVALIGIAAIAFGVWHNIQERRMESDFLIEEPAGEASDATPQP